MTKILGISGSLSSPSRTRTLVETIVHQLNISVHGKTELIRFGGKRIGDLTLHVHCLVTAGQPQKAVA